MHKGAFLGPKAENATELEELLLEVLRDHVFWRRNFHPSDPRLINESDKRTDAYGDMSAQLRDELFQILARLKRAAPVYSPRQIAHMVSDPTLPALVGYFAGMLYNQNNVVAEVSPETVREERAYLAALAEMVAYPRFLPEQFPSGADGKPATFSWGHLCSGGTVANLEALWIARNVRFFPLAVRLLASRSDEFAQYLQLPIHRANGERERLEKLTTFQLSNLPVSAITALHLRVKEELASADAATVRHFQASIPSVRKAGIAAFLLQYNEAFPDDAAQLPRVFISQAAHYGWKKNMDILGLGADALTPVPVDKHIRLDVAELKKLIYSCASEGRPVLGVISICGTTEEGAVDPLHEVEALRTEVAREGLSFWHHCDAAFGGYFASMLPKDGRAFLPPDEVGEDFPLGEVNGLISEKVYRGIAAISETDSVTIDPHKFGYVPYPAGAVLFRDFHVRDAISYAAPYLDSGDRTGFGGFLGQWTLEGSRPGAAAVSCYLSQALVPLNESGHGQLIKNCIRVNRQLVKALEARFSSESEIQINAFAEPDTVGYCFALVPRGGVASVSELNDYTLRTWQHLTVDGREDINQYDFMVSKTEVNIANYRHVLRESFGGDLPDVGKEDSLLLLRSCIMNPFLSDWDACEPRYSEQFAEYLYKVALDEASENTPTSEYS